MRQAYIPFVGSYEEEETDTPMEGKKSCMAEAYKEGIYNLSEEITIEVDQKLLN